MTARNRFAGLALIIVVGALFAGPATALAQDALSNPSASQYEPKSQVQGEVQGASTTGSNTAAAVADTSSSSSGSSTGTLPFTGMDVLVLSAVALALVGTGVALRRLSTPKAPRS
jgi:hypothetical protein